MTQRDETDQVEILSGVDDGRTLGTPIVLIVRNEDQNSGAYDHMEDLYRPSHADWTTEAKYGIRAVAGGGTGLGARRPSAESLLRAIARKLAGGAARGRGARLGGAGPLDPRSTCDSATRRSEPVEAGPTRCPDAPRPPTR